MITKQRSIQRIYHLADERNWESIQTYGLLSAVQLFMQANFEQWIRQYRSETIQLPTGVIIRDQRPMPPTALARCLTSDLTPPDWYELLNQHVFFWLELERLDRQRRACGTPQYVITINATALLAQYNSQASVTPFNIGNARRAAARRGLASFVPYNTWVNSGWESEALALGTKPRQANHQPVELAITGAIPNIFDFIDEVHLYPNF